MRDHVRNQVRSWLASGVLEYATGPAVYNSPVFAIPKKDVDGVIVKARFVVDPRRINEHISTVDYPLPQIADIHEIESRYHQFWVADADQPKTAITVDNVRYKFRRCPSNG